jgi:hypothetical protein
MASSSKWILLVAAMAATGLMVTGCGDGTVQEEVVREEDLTKGRQQGGGMIPTKGITD